MRILPFCGRVDEGLTYAALTLTQLRLVMEQPAAFQTDSECLSQRFDVVVQNRRVMFEVSRLLTLHSYNLVDDVRQCL
jgi:hypothetical protein